MVRTLKKVMAMLLAGVVTVIAPVNVSAMSDTNNVVMLSGYRQRSSSEVQFSQTVQATVAYGVQSGVDVSGTISLNYQWDEGYDSEFTSGSGYAKIDTTLDGWSVEVRHIKTTGRTILFQLVLFRDGKEAGSSYISYYVDEYGQVF